MTTSEIDRRPASPSDGRSAASRLTGLPMPKDTGMLFDARRRLKVNRQATGRFPFPVPNGWFIVASSADVGPEDVVSLHYFGRDLVLFRDTAGRPHVLDAYCAHLGAHLGVGGMVEGGCLRCPFHGWAYDGETGRCVDVPYDPDGFMPKRAFVRAYPTVERNHMIWAWHHLEDKPPFYDVPEVPEFHDPDWLPIVVRDFEIATCCQEMAENNVDRAHFKFVHGTEAIPEEDFVTDGAYKRAVGQGGAFVREGYGLGLGVLRVHGFTTFLSSTTPLDEDNIHVRWIFTAPRSLGEDTARKAADSFCEGVSQDIPIWENKVYRDAPLLRAMEKDISEHRRWCLQFYSFPDEDADAGPRRGRRDGH